MKTLLTAILLTIANFSYSQYAILFCNKVEYNVYVNGNWIEQAEEWEENVLKFYNEYIVHENAKMIGTYTLKSFKKLDDGTSVFKVVSHKGNTFEWALDDEGKRIVFFYNDDDGYLKNIEFFIYHKQFN